MFVPFGEYGPIFDLKLFVSHFRESALRASNKPVKPPASVPALLDTGADCTLVDYATLASLGLSPTGLTQISSLDSSEHLGHMRRVYDVDIVFMDGERSSSKFTMQVAEHSFGPLPYKAIIGRDLLRFCTFSYIGGEEEVVLNI